MGGMADALEGGFDAFPRPQSTGLFTQQVTGVEPIGRLLLLAILSIPCCNTVNLHVSKSFGRTSIRSYGLCHT